MASTSRIILAILVATCAGLALCLALVFGSLDRLSLRTAEANVDFLLSQLRDTIEANVGLGLPLSDVRVVQDLIERAKATDDQVLAVEVFSPDGLSLFNTDRGSIGEPISPLWQNAIRYRIENERWRIEELGNIVVGAVIRNDFAEPVGYLAVVVAGEARSLHGGTVLAGLARQAALVVPAVLLVVIVAALAVLRLSNRNFGALSARLAADPPASGGPDLPEALAVRADAVRRSIDGAVVHFDRATADVLRIDEDDGRHAA
jgi:hypothetical protein